MTNQQFNKLSQSNQQKTISQSGRVLINFLQGDKVLRVFKLDELFVMMHMHGDGALYFETLDDIGNLKLYNHQFTLST